MSYECVVPQLSFADAVPGATCNYPTADTKRKRLAQIAGRCPVHKTLAHGVEFADSVTFVP